MAVAVAVVVVAEEDWAIIGTVIENSASKEDLYLEQLQVQCLWDVWS